MKTLNQKHESTSEFDDSMCFQRIDVIQFNYIESIQ